MVRLLSLIALFSASPAFASGGIVNWYSKRGALCGNFRGFICTSGDFASGPCL